MRQDQINRVQGALLAYGIPNVLTYAQTTLAHMLRPHSTHGGELLNYLHNPFEGALNTVDKLNTLFNNIVANPVATFYHKWEPLLRALDEIIESADIGGIDLAPIFVLQAPAPIAAPAGLAALPDDFFM